MTKKEESPVLSMSVQEIMNDYVWRYSKDKIQDRAYSKLYTISYGSKGIRFYDEFSSTWNTRKELAEDFESKKISELED